MCKVRTDPNSLIVIIISSIFVFFHFGLSFMVSYQPDIYSTINSPDALVQGYIYPGGRLALALIVWLIRKPIQSYCAFYYISLISSMVVLDVAVVAFSDTIIRRLQKKTKHRLPVESIICVGLISCLTITNLFSAEFSLYPNSFLGFAIDILLCVVASMLFIKIVDGETSYKVVIAIVACLIFAVFIYEPVLAVFVILSSLFSIIESQDIKSFVKLQVYCALFYGFAMGVKLVYTKFIINSSRAQFNEASFAETAKEAVMSGRLPEVFIMDRITFGMWTFTVVSFIIVAVIMFKSIKGRQLYILLKIVYLTLVTVIMGTLPFIVRLSNDYKPRIYYPLGLYFGVLTIFGLLSGTIMADSINDKRIVISCVVVMISAQWLSFVQMNVDQYITNYDDKQISEIIGNCIDEYEAAGSQKVKYVVFYCDEVRTKYIRNNGWCITERAYDAEWSKLPALNFYLGRGYQQGIPDAEIAEYYANKDWSAFSPEQVIIKGDTAHVCTF